MRFSSDRAGLSLLVALGALQLGCPKPKPQPLPPKPAGDVLRIGGKQGDTASGKVSVRIEDSDAGSKKRPKVVAFLLNEEHTVSGVKDGGTLSVTAKFFDIEAQGETPKEKKENENLARALSEVKITYDVDTRGNVSSLDVGNVPEKFLPMARQIATWVYGADRGPMFDAGPVEVGKGWVTRAQIPIPAGGNKNWEINGSYDKKDKNLALLKLTGKVSGESQGTQVSGEIVGEVSLDVDAGRLVHQDIDSQSTFRTAEQTSGGHMIHIHMTWDQTPGGAAPAAPAAAAGGGDGTAIMN